MTCTQPDCDRRIKARGLCSTHWARARQRGDFATVTATRLADLIEDVEFMLEAGESPAMIAARLHTTPAALEQRMRRNGHPDLARPFEAEARAVEAMRVGA